MKWKKEDLPALRELEATVLTLWKSHPEMNDSTAGRAYAAAHQFHRARARGHVPKPPALSPLELETFHALQQVCARQSASGPMPVKGMPDGNTGPVPVEKLVDYLRELEHSVERHTKLGGRFGYLEFIRGYIP